MKWFRRRRPREAVSWQRGSAYHARRDTCWTCPASSLFDSFVDGCHDLDVGNVNGRVVTGLSRGTTYYTGFALMIPPVRAITQMSSGDDRADGGISDSSDIRRFDYQ